MRDDRLRWNEKYAKRDWPAEPSDIVRRFYNRAKTGWALDIGAGNGRNALFLAGQGFDVLALDISEAGLKHIAGLRPNLHPVCVDLDDFEIKEGRFDLILNIRFLNRRLYPWIISGLADGGILIFETYIEFPDNGRHRHSPDYYLEENELLRVFLPLHIIYYEETETRTEEGVARTASLVAEKR